MRQIQEIALLLLGVIVVVFVLMMLIHGYGSLARCWKKVVKRRALRAAATQQVYLRRTMRKAAITDDVAFERLPAFEPETVPAELRSSTRAVGQFRSSARTQFPVPTFGLSESVECPGGDMSEQYGIVRNRL